MTLRNLMTSLLALTLVVCVVGCDSDTDETSNLAAWSECYTAGFCSEAAAQGYFTEAQGNIHAGETMESSGCESPANRKVEWGQGAGYLRSNPWASLSDPRYAIVQCVAN